MSFGQYTTGTRHYYPSTPIVGRRRVRDMIAGLPRDGWVKAIRTAHNEVTRFYPKGRRLAVVRLHDTDIVTLYRNGRIVLDNGGWYTPTTATHMTGAIKGLTGRYISVYNNTRKKGKPTFEAAGQKSVHGRLTINPEAIP